MSDAYFATTAALLKEYKVYATITTTQIGTFTTGFTTIDGAMVNWMETDVTTTTRIAPSAIPAIGGIFAHVGMGVTVFAGIAEIASSPDPDLAGIKDGLVIGAGLAVAALAAPELVAFFGSVAVGEGLAALFGGAASYAVDAAWTITLKRLLATERRMS